MLDARCELLRALEGDGLVQLGPSGASTSPRFRSAMARAALRLFQAGDASDDLRVPIAMALLDVCDGGLSDDDLAGRVEVMLALEVAELGPTLGRAR